MLRKMRAYQYSINFATIFVNECTKFSLQVFFHTDFFLNYITHFALKTVEDFSRHTKANTRVRETIKKNN